MKKNIVRIKAPEATVSSTDSAAPEPSEAFKSTLRAAESDDDSASFVPRPWVNVKPSFPWRPALIALSIVALVVVALIFIKPEVGAQLDPEAEIALMAEAMPDLDRHADPYEEVSDSEAVTEIPVEEGIDDVVGEELLKTLIVKVSDNQIRANGKLVTLNDLSKLCELTEDSATLKLINRRGDTKIVEAVVRVLESSQLRYHFVNN